MKDQNCANCYFFLQTSERGKLPTLENPEGVQKIGYCRAAPPTPYFEKDCDSGLIVPKIGRFPVVLNNMWCGSFDYADTVVISKSGEAA